MSFLTKLAIVLHVVLTMLFVSAAVVLVNRTDNFATANKTLETNLGVETRKAQAAMDEASAARSDAKAVQAQAAAEVDRIRQQFNAGQTAMRERDTQLATAQQNQSAANARLASATAALVTAQKTVATLQDQLNQTRTASDKTQQQSTELLTANADLNSRLQTALRQFRNANEELESAKNEIQDLQERGGTPATANAGGNAGGSSPTGGNTTLSINGVIREQKNINGVNYATISVGSADQVTKGMTFNVIERGANGDFLGYLTVDRVEQNEASGIIKGPRVADIKSGNEVRTQL